MNYAKISNCFKTQGPLGKATQGGTYLLHTIMKTSDMSNEYVYPGTHIVNNHVLDYPFVVIICDPSA